MHVYVYIGNKFGRSFEQFSLMMTFWLTIY